MAEETLQNHRPDLPQVTAKLYHIMLHTSPWAGFELTTSVVIDTDCIGSCKSNYHTITATTNPVYVYLFVSVCNTCFTHVFVFYNWVVCFTRVLLCFTRALCDVFLNAHIVLVQCVVLHVHLADHNVLVCFTWHVLV